MKLGSMLLVICKRKSNYISLSQILLLLPTSSEEILESPLSPIKHRKLTNYELRTAFSSIYFPRSIVIMSIFSPIFHTNFCAAHHTALSLIDDAAVA